MHRVNMDSDFDRTAVVESLTINNLSTVSFKEMLDILEPLVLTEIPEGDFDKKRLDFLLSRLANLHAYLWTLWCHATSERARLKKIDDVKAENMQKKKEALYALAGAVKLKYEAVSRKITVALEDEDEPVDRADYEGRRARRDEVPARKAAPTSGGWGNIR